MRTNTLRRYQIEAVNAVCSLLAKTPAARAVVNLPTGMGKTTVGMAAVSRLGARTLWLCHTDEIVTQTRREASARLGKASVGVVKAEQDNPGAHFVLATVQTAQNERRLDAIVASGAFGMVVVDECHHAPADTWSAILDRFPGVPVIGLTATTERGDERQLGGVFSEGIVYRVETAQAIDAGWLVPPLPRRVVEPRLADLLREGDYSESEKAALREGCAGTTAGAVAEALAEGRKAIVFTVSVEQAERVAGLLVRSGYPAASLSGETPKSERKEILRRLKAGALRAVCNCAVLTEGFDEPSVDAIVVARPTTSRTQYIQMAGRGLRKAPGKRDCLIVDLVGVTVDLELYTAADIHGPEAEERKRQRIERDREKQDKEAEILAALARAIVGPNGELLCGFEGCGRKMYCNGLCSEHRNQERRGKDLRRLREKERQEGMCAREGCGRKAYSKGMCAGHRQTLVFVDEDDPSKCEFPECLRKATSMRLCAAHYRQKRGGATLKPLRVRVPAKKCLGPGCTRKARAKGMCHSHYMQKWEGHSLAPLKPKLFASKRSRDNPS